MKTTIKYRKPIAEHINASYEEHPRFWEHRMHLDDIFMELALPWNTDANVVEIAHCIVNYCKERFTMPTNVSWEVIDNVLYANDESISRVGPSHRFDNVDDDNGLYWEGRCLAMGAPVN